LDKAENIIAISEIAKVICFDAAYNRSCEGANAMHAYNWDEIYTLIEKMA